MTTRLAKVNVRKMPMVVAKKAIQVATKNRVVNTMHAFT